MAIDNDITGVSSVDLGANAINGIEQANNIVETQASTQNNITGIHTDITNTEYYSNARKLEDDTIRQWAAGATDVALNTNTSTTTPPQTHMAKSTRDEIMSKLNLVDENLNYTDTYTNYINNGGIPPEGYAQYSQQLLLTEKNEAIFKREDAGLISHEDALLQAYGDDILAANGYNVRSAGWWISKWSSLDYTSPYTNKYIMDSVLDQAEQMYQSDQAQALGNQSLQESTLADLVTNSRDITVKEYKDLFKENWDETLSSLSDDKLLKAFTDKNFSTQYRLLNVEGTYYYLHTDGEMYVLDGGSGTNHGEIKVNPDGTLGDIKLNGTAGTAVLSALNGFAGVFTSIVKVAAVPFSWVVAALDGEEDSFMEATTKLGDGLDNWLNDNVNWLQENGYVNLDGKNSGEEWLYFGSRLAGQIAGTLALGAGMGKLMEGGGKLTTLGDSLKATGHNFFGNTAKAGGWLLKTGGKLAKATTGNFGSTLPGDTIGAMWRSHALTSTMANMKGFLNDYQNMKSQALYSGADVSDGDIIKRAAAVNTMNFAFDMLLSGGMSDNTTQRFGFLKANKKLRTALSDLEAAAAKQNGVLDGVESQLLKNYLSASNHIIRMNTVADFLGNFINAEISKNANIQDGKIVDTSLFKEGFFSEGTLANALSSGVMAYQYSYRSQKASYNEALGQVIGVHKQILDTFDTKMAKSKNMEDIQTLDQVKKDYIRKFNEFKGTPTQKALHAMSTLTDKLGDGKNVPSIIDDSFKSIVPQAKLARLQNISKYAEAEYYARFNDMKDLIQNPTAKGSVISRLIKGPFKEIFAKDGYLRANQKSKLELTQAQLNDMKSEVEGLYNWLGITPEQAQSLENSLNDPKDTSGFMTQGLLVNDDLREPKSKQIEQVVETLKANNVDPTRTAVWVLENDKQNIEGYRETEDALKLLADVGIVAKVGDNAYALSIDNPTGYAISADEVKSTINDMMKLAQPSLNKVDILNDLVNVVGIQEAYKKASYVASALHSLHRSGRITGTEAAKLYADYVQSNKLKFSLKHVSNRYSSETANIIREYDAMNEILKVIAETNGSKEQLESHYPKLKEKLSDGDADMWSRIFTTLQEDKYISQDFVISDIVGRIRKDFLSSDLINEEKLMAKLLTPLGQLDHSFTDILIEGNTEQAKAILREALEVMYPQQEFNWTDDWANQILDDATTLLKNTATYSPNSDKVYLNLADLFGAKTDAFLRDIHSRGSKPSNRLSDYDSYKSNQAQIKQEQQTRSDLLSHNANKGLFLTYDLSNEKDLNDLGSILHSMHYLDNANPTKAEILNALSKTSTYGIISKQDSTMKLDIKNDEKDTLNKALDILRTGKAGEEFINRGRLIRKDNTGNEAPTKVDIVEVITQNNEVKGVSENVGATVLAAPLLRLLPINEKISSSEELGYSVFRNCLSDDIEGVKSGKLAAKTKSLFIPITKQGQVYNYEEQTDLANYFVVRTIYDNINANPTKATFNVRLTEAEYDDYIARGLVHEVGDTKSDAYWTAVRNADGLTTITIDTTKLGDMYNSIYSTKFNMEKFLPIRKLFTKDVVLRPEQQTVGGYWAGAELSGDIRSNIISLIQDKFPWDDNQGTATTKFWTTFRDTEDFNPIKTVYDKPEDLKFDTIEDFNAYINKVMTTESKNPYEILLKTYLTEYNKLIHEGEGGGDHTILMDNPRLMRYMNDSIDEGLSKEAIVNNVYKNFKNYSIANKNNTSGGLDLYTPSVYANSTPDTDLDTVGVTRSSLKYNLGDNLRYTDSTAPDGEWLPSKEVISKAYDELVAIKNAEEEAYNRYYNANTFVDYEESDASKLLKSIAAGEGSIPIEDCEKISQLISKTENEMNEKVSDKNAFEFMNKESIAIFNQLFGNKAQSVAAQIFNKAQDLRSIRQSGILLPDTMAQYRSPGAPSVETKGDGSFLDRNSYKNTKNEDGTTTKTQLPTTIDGLMLDLYDNRQKNLARQNGDDFQKIPELMEAGKTKRNFNAMMLQSLTKDLLDRTDLSSYKSSAISVANTIHTLLFSEVSTFDNFTKNVNKMNPSIDTSDPTVRKNLGETIRVVTANSQGIGKGEYTPYFLMDSKGEIVNEAVSTNKHKYSYLNDMLFTNEKDLIGKTLIVAKKSSVRNMTGADLSYYYIKDQQDLNKLKTATWTGWVNENKDLIESHFKGDNISTQLLLSDVSEEKLDEIYKYVSALTISQKGIRNAAYDAAQDFFSRAEDGSSTLTKEQFIREIYHDYTVGSFTHKGFWDAIAEVTANVTTGDRVDVDTQELDKTVSFVSNGFSLNNLNENETTSVNTLRDLIDEKAPDMLANDVVKQQDLDKLMKTDDIDKVLTRIKNSGNYQEKDIVDLISGYILKKVVNDKDVSLQRANFMDIVMRDKSFKDIYNNRDSNSQKMQVWSNNSIDTRTLHQLFSDISEGVSNKDYTARITYDTETSTVKFDPANNKYIFNLGLHITRWDGNKWITENRNYFIDYGESTAQWITENDIRNSTFCKSNQGYSDILDKYETMSVDRPSNFKTPDEIKSELQSLFDTGRVLFVGYNSEDADIPWMKACGLIDDNMLAKVTNVDLYQTAKNVLLPEGVEYNHKLKLENFARILDLDTTGEHSADADAFITDEALKYVINNQVNINTLKARPADQVVEMLRALGVSDNSMQRVLSKIDDKIQDIKGLDFNFKDTFGEYESSARSISTLSNIVKMFRNKMIADLTYDLNTSDRPTYELSLESQKALESFNPNRIFSLIEFAESKDIELDKILGTMSNVFSNTYGTSSDDAFVTLFTNDSMLLDVMHKLNLDPNEFSKYVSENTSPHNKDIFKRVLDSDKIPYELKESYKDYKNNQGSIVMYNTAASVVKEIGINDPTTIKSLMIGLLKGYSRPQGSDIKSYFMQDNEVISSRAQQAYDDIMTSRYGDLDALFATKQNGMYKLIGAFPPNATVKDNISGEDVTLDASMCVLSKDTFRKLMGQSVEDYVAENGTKDLYTNLLIHPADKIGQIQPRRIIVDDSVGEKVQVSELTIKILNARDMDGDHLVVLKPRQEDQGLLAAYLQTAYVAHNINEELFQKLSIMSGQTKMSSQESIIHSVAGLDDSVIKLCNEADKELKNTGHVSDTTTNEFIRIVEDLKQTNTDLAGISTDDILKALWVKTVNYGTDDITYINNPYIRRDNSYSQEQFAKDVALREQVRQRLRGIDSITGFEEKQQLGLYNIVDDVIDKPLEQMTVPNIYMESAISDAFKNISWDADNTAEFIKTLRTSISTHYPEGNTDANVNTIIDNLSNNLISKNTLEASLRYLNLVQYIENSIRTNDETNALIKSQLASDDMQKMFAENAEILQAKERGLKYITERNRLKKISSYSSLDEDTGSFLLNQELAKAKDDLKTLWSIEYPLSVKSKAFVITGIESDSEIMPAGEDHIYVVGKGLSRAHIESIEDENGEKKYSVVRKPLDGQVKIATASGAKGDVNTDYKITNSHGLKGIDFLYQRSKADKLMYVNASDRSKTTTIELESGGKKLKVTGYTISTDAAIVEDTHEFSDNDVYKLDLLHVVHDSKDIQSQGLLGGFETKLNKDGTLTLDNTQLVNIINAYKKMNLGLAPANIAGGIQSCKMAFIINHMTDADIQKEFKLSRQDAINMMTNTSLDTTDLYDSRINTLLKKYNISLDDSPLMKKLFENDFFDLDTRYITSYQGDVKNATEITAKKNADKQTAKDTKVIRASMTSPTDYQFDGSLKRENTEDIHMDLYHFINKISDYKVSAKQIETATKNGLLGTTEYIPESGTIPNGFKMMSADHTYDAPTPSYSRRYDNEKVGRDGEPNIIKGKYSYGTSEYYEIPERYKLQMDLSSNKTLDTYVNNMIKNQDTYLYNNKGKILGALERLALLPATATAKQKQQALFNDTDSIIKTNLRTPEFYWDAKDGEQLRLNNPKDVIGTKKELLKQANSITKNYFHYSTINDYLKDKSKASINDIKSDLISMKQNSDAEIAAKTKERDKAFDKLFDLFILNKRTGEVNADEPLDKYLNKRSSEVQMPTLSYGKENVDIFEKDKTHMTSSGLKENTPEQLGVARAQKYMESSASYMSQEPMYLLEQVEQSRNKFGVSDEDFSKYTLYKSILASKNISDDDYNARLEHFNISKDVDMDKFIKEFDMRYGAVGFAYSNYVNSMINMVNTIKNVTNEDFDPLPIILSPMKPKSSTMSSKHAVSAINSLINLQRFDYKNCIEAATGFDFYNSSKSIVQAVTKEYGMRYMADELSRQGLIDNVDLISKTIDIFDKVASEEKEYGRKITDNDLQVKNIVVSEIADLVKFNPERFFTSTSVFKGYRNLFSTISDELDMFINKFNMDYNSETTKSFSDFNRILNSTSDKAIKNQAQVIVNYYWAKIITGQAMMDNSKELVSSMSNYIDSLAGQGYSLVNKFGQKYEMGGTVKPVTSSSYGFLKDSIEIQANSTNKEKWTQFIVEKIFSGDIYTMRNDIVDHLDKNVYTTTVPGNTMKMLKNVSKWSASLQMALPTKILNRLVSFTGFDYAMGLTYDWKTALNISRARREILGAYQSKGTNIKPGDDLYEYFIREGQPVGLTGKDPITFQEELSGPDRVKRILDTMTDPLEIQNHLGRYAIWLTAKENFENGTPNYGPVYNKKDAIDALPTNYDKAMYIMDYMLGSPGGFPKLSRDLSGLMLYATFPMNLTRTLGSYGMSLGKLAKEGFTAENAPHWMRSVVMPSLGVAGVSMLASAISEWICDLYDVDEETKKKYLKKHMTIDPVGTLIGDTPTFSSSSMDPVSNVQEMYVTPFTDDNNDTIWKKLFGFANTNVFSHLNPVIKTPIEIATGTELYGSSPISTKYYYTGTENAIRKVLGFFIGSATANSIVQQMQIDRGSKDTNAISSILTGFKRGVANSIGNQKSYKKDTTNYYNQIYQINGYKQLSNSDNVHNADLEELVTTQYLYNYYQGSGSSIYGQFDKDDYKTISNRLKTMINNKEDPEKVYGLIIDEYNKGTSVATLMSVLDNNSIVRKLNKLKNPDAYISSLSAKQRERLMQAIDYEEAMYPMLDEFFPYKSYKYNSVPKYRKTYLSSPGGGYSSHPKTGYPYTPYWNPDTYSSYKKYKSYRPNVNIGRVRVDVSPEMAVWSNDYNELKDLKRPIQYRENPVYNNLSGTQKDTKVGKGTSKYTYMNNQAYNGMTGSEKKYKAGEK